jgi:hypothetical protein
MHMRIAIWFFTVLLCLPVVRIGLSADDAAARGRLIKGSLPSVYYVGSDDRRYVFPNERIYRSWYADFSTVDEVDDDELAEYPLGGNVTYRPGTRLVKLTNDPKVYAVEPGGVLRWVSSEAVADGLWGSGWAGRVDDLPDGFFSSYSIGTDLAEARYPEGALLERDDAFFVVWGGGLRELSGSAVEKNGLQTSFAVSVDGTVEPDGDHISGREDFLNDTAQIGLGKTLADDVVVEEAPFDDTVARGSDGAVIGAFVVSVAAETDMRDPRLVVSAATSADVDADPGGLVRGDGDETQLGTNLGRMRLADAAGTILFGTKRLNDDADGDGEQTLSFSGSATLPVGRHVLYVLADVDADAPEDERYRVALDVAATDWYVDDDRAKRVLPDTVEGGAVTVVEGNVTVTRDASVVSSVVLRGQDGPFDAAAFAFESALDEAAYVNGLTLTAYLDADEGDDDFSAGTDADPYGTLAASDVVASVSLARASDGVVLATERGVGLDGRVTFDGVDLELAPGADTSLVVLVTLDADAPTGLSGDRLAFDVASGDDAEIKDASGDDVEVEADEPNGGNNPKSFLTVLASGTLTIDGEGEPDAVVTMGSDDVPFYTLTLVAGESEDMEVNALSFAYVSQDAGRDVEQATLAVDGAEYAGSATVSGITFTGMDLVVPAGEEIDAEVRLDIASSSRGARSGDLLGLSFEPATLRVYGAASGARLDADDVGNAIADVTEPGSEATVRRNKPVVEAVEDVVDTTQRADDDMELLRFTMRSEGEGTSRLERLAFKIEPDDVGERGADNDLLEELADVNGDARDDNDAATLFDETEGDVLGEDADGRMKFFIFDKSESARDATPAGLDTAAGDYGVVVIEFTSPYALLSEAHEFAFRLNALGMAGDRPHVRATLLGGDDFAWNDGSSSVASQNGDALDVLPIDGPRVAVE